MFALNCSAVVALTLGIAPHEPRSAPGLSTPQQLQSGVGRGVADRAGALLWTADDERRELERRSEEGFKRQLAQLGRQFAPPLPVEDKRTDPPTLDEMMKKSIERDRKFLAFLQAEIKKIEEEPDPRVRESKATLLKKLKEMEAVELRRAERRERPVQPYPWMPMARPGDIRPRPPVRD